MLLHSLRRSRSSEQEMAGYGNKSQKRHGQEYQDGEGHEGRPGKISLSVATRRHIPTISEIPPAAARKTQAGLPTIAGPQSGGYSESCTAQ